MSGATVIPNETLQGLRLERHGFTFINRTNPSEPRPEEKSGLAGFINSLVSKNAQRRRDVDWLNEGVKQLIENHGAAFVIDQLKAILAIAEQAEREGK